MVRSMQNDELNYIYLPVSRNDSGTTLLNYDAGGKDGTCNVAGGFNCTRYNPGRRPATSGAKRIDASMNVCHFQNLCGILKVPDLHDINGVMIMGL